MRLELDSEQLSNAFYGALPAAGYVLWISSIAFRPIFVLLWIAGTIFLFLMIFMVYFMMLGKKTASGVFAFASSVFCTCLPLVLLVNNWAQLPK